jgi:hypothetical protein
MTMTCRSDWFRITRVYDTELIARGKKYAYNSNNSRRELYLSTYQ